MLFSIFFFLFKPALLQHKPGLSHDHDYAVLLSHLEDLSISIEHIDGDFYVLLNALPSSLEVSSLQGQVQVIADVTWT